MRTRYVYDKGRPVYVEEGGVVILDDRETEQRAGHFIMPDIKPYISMIDGREITSRSKHREHLRAHGCFEVGNDSSLSQKPQPLKPPPGLKDSIIEAAHKLKFL